MPVWEIDIPCFVAELDQTIDSRDSGLPDAGGSNPVKEDDVVEGPVRAHLDVINVEDETNELEKPVEEDKKKKRKLEDIEVLKGPAGKRLEISSALTVGESIVLPKAPSNVEGSLERKNGQEDGGSKVIAAGCDLAPVKNWRDSIDSSRGQDFGFDFRYAGPHHITQDPAACLNYLLSMNSNPIPYSSTGLVPSLGAFQEWAQARVQAEAAGNFFFATYLREAKEGLIAREAPRKLEEEKARLSLENESLAKKNAALARSEETLKAEVTSLSEEVAHLKATESKADLLEKELAEERRKGKALLAVLEREREETAARLERIRAYNKKVEEKSTCYVQLKVLKDLQTCLSAIPQVPEKVKQQVGARLPELENLFESMPVPKLFPGDLPSDPEAKGPEEIGEKVDPLDVSS